MAQYRFSDLVEIDLIKVWMEQTVEMTGISASLWEADDSLIVCSSNPPPIKIPICKPAESIHPFLPPHQDWSLVNCMGNLRQIHLPLVLEGGPAAKFVLGNFILENEPIDLDGLAQAAALTGESFEALQKAVVQLPRVSLNLLEVIVRRCTPVISFQLAIARRSLTLKKEIEDLQRLGKIQQKTEKRYRAIFNGIRDAIFVESAEGDILDVNDSACAMFGYTREEMLQLKVPNLVPPGRPIIFFNPERANGSVVETTNITKDGQLIPVELSASRDDIDGKLVLLVVARDISGRKNAERAQRESEERLEMAMRATNDGLWDWDIPTGSHHFSPRWFHMLGYEVDELPSTYSTWLSLLHPDDKMHVLQEINATLENDLHAYEVEVRMRTKQGDWRWILSRGKVVLRSRSGKALRVVGTHLDITDRKKMEANLRASEQKFYKAFQTSPDSVNINRLSDGLYIDVNQGFCELTGYSPGEVIGKSSIELSIWVDPEDRFKMAKAVLENGEINNLEARFRKKDGTIKIGSLSARMIEVEGVKCVLSITRDITDRKQAEEQILRVHNELEVAYQATLEGWNRALGLRDEATKNHTDRSVLLTLQLARAVGVPKEKLIHIQRGAILHDIGKISIPDSILNKPGRLSTEEWTVMRRHPQYAYDLLWPIEYLRPALEIPLCHHEKWDGSGYPRGLKGEAIPLAARIFAVADVWDALSTDRPYRPAWKHDEVYNYLVENSGSHFDPAILKIFLELIDQEKP